MVDFWVVRRVFIWHDELSEYWQWVLAALLVLLPLDLFTMMYAVATVGIEHEANDIMVWVLGYSLPGIIAIHIAVIVVAVGLLDLHFRVAQRSEHRRVMITGGKVYKQYKATASGLDPEDEANYFPTF